MLSIQGIDYDRETWPRCGTYVDWQRGSPYVFESLTAEELEEMRRGGSESSAMRRIVSWLCHDGFYGPSNHDRVQLAKCFTCNFRSQNQRTRKELFPTLSCIQHIGYELGENSRAVGWYRANHWTPWVATINAVMPFCFVKKGH